MAFSAFTMLYNHHLYPFVRQFITLKGHSLPINKSQLQSILKVHTRRLHTQETEIQWSLEYFQNFPGISLLGIYPRKMKMYITQRAIYEWL